MMKEAPAPPEIWGESEAVLAVKDRLSRAAQVNRPILLLGERGTGKELAAARLHYLSRRWSGPYLALNCAALSPSLLDSELFGHESGAFTGASHRRAGLFEAADGGSLFLDEISHLSLSAQARILRVVEYGAFQAVGSPRERRVDVRLISASNTDLPAMSRQGLFLPDLYDRLSFEVITLPPLRDRGDDISLLAHRFAARMAQELGRAGAEFSARALAKLEAYVWPGNVRELKNVVERAVYRSSGLRIGAAAVELPSPGADAGRRDLVFPLGEGGFDRLLAERGRQIIEEALIRARHNQRQAAGLLGLSYHRFRFLRRKFRGDAG